MRKVYKNLIIEEMGVGNCPDQHPLLVDNQLIAERMRVGLKTNIMLWSNSGNQQSIEARCECGKHLLTPFTLGSCTVWLPSKLHQEAAAVGSRIRWFCTIVPGIINSMLVTKFQSWGLNSAQKYYLISMIKNGSIGSTDFGRHQATWVLVHNYRFYY